MRRRLARASRARQVAVLLESKPISVLAIETVLYREQIVEFIGKLILNDHLGTIL